MRNSYVPLADPFSHAVRAMSGLGDMEERWLRRGEAPWNRTETEEKKKQVWHGIWSSVWNCDWWFSPLQLIIFQVQFCWPHSWRSSNWPSLSGAPTFLLNINARHGILSKHAMINRCGSSSSSRESPLPMPNCLSFGKNSALLRCASSVFHFKIARLRGFNARKKENCLCITMIRCGIVGGGLWIHW